MVIRDDGVPVIGARINRKPRPGWCVSGRIGRAGAVGPLRRLSARARLGPGARWVDYRARKGTGCVILAHLRAC